MKCNLAVSLKSFHKEARQLCILWYLAYVAHMCSLLDNTGQIPFLLTFPFILTHPLSHVFQKRITRLLYYNGK